MFDYKNFMAKIDLIGEQIYYRLGFADTFIIFFRHGYKSTELQDDYIIVKWENDGYTIDYDFNEGQNFYIIDNVISMLELQRLLNKKICDFI